MGHIRLERVDDVLRDYWLYHDRTCIGEIRPRGFGTAELHMADARYLLRRDDTADALGRRAGYVRALASMVTLQGRYSLREGERTLARAERRFHLSTRRDGLQLWPDAAASEGFFLRKRGALRGSWMIEAPDGPSGHVDCSLRAREFAWHGPALPAAVTVFALYALHQQFGAHPDAGSTGGE